MNPTTVRRTNCFTPVELQKLPVNLLPLGRVLRESFEQFGILAKMVLEHLGYLELGTHSNFLKNELNELLDATDLGEQTTKSRGQTDRKASWDNSSKYVVLQAIQEGQEELEFAFLALMKDDVQGYAKHLINAGISLGHLTLINCLCDDHVYKRIGSFSGALLGASKGGKESGITRRNDSKVPAPALLRIEHEKLVRAGKPVREIAAMLASRYRCTSDHIRKVLKRD